MEQDRTRWDGRYAGQTPPTAQPPEILTIAPHLADHVPRRGRALDLACGTGAQSLWLAARGLNVVAVDVSPVAIDLLVRAARASRDDIDARVHDADDGLPADLNGLAVILCQRFRTPDLYDAFVARLDDGGVLLLTVLSAVGADGADSPYHAAPGELLAAFGGQDVLFHAERDGVASIAVRRGRGGRVS